MSNLESVRSLFFNHMIPLTKMHVELGGHIFNAVITTRPAINYFKEDEQLFNILSVGTNRRYVNPLFHGEVDAINNYYDHFMKDEVDANCYPVTKDVIMIASHQPCLMCTFSLSWIQNLTNVYYVFNYDDTAKMFDMRTDRQQWNTYIDRVKHDYTEPYNILGVNGNIHFRQLNISDLLKAELTVEYLKLYEIVKQKENL